MKGSGLVLECTSLQLWRPTYLYQHRLSTKDGWCVIIIWQASYLWSIYSSNLTWKHIYSTFWDFGCVGNVHQPLKSCTFLNSQTQIHIPQQSDKPQDLVCIITIIIYCLHVLCMYKSKQISACLVFFVLLNSLLTLLSLWLYQVQIGCQTDNLDHLKELRRAPCVKKIFRITKPMMQVWNLWGGLLYLVAPPNTQVEGLKVSVERAVLSPYFKSGEYQ